MLPEYIGGWTELWLGFRFRLNPVYFDTALFNDETLLGFGLCVGGKSWNQDAGSGLSSSKVVPDHFLGIFGPATASVQVMLKQSAGLWYADGSWFWKKSVLGVEAQATGYTARCSADPAARSLMIGRFVRGSPNWVLETFFPDVPSSVTDVSDAKFASLMSSPDWATLLANKPTGYESTFPLVSTLPVDTAVDGEFDSVFFSWNKTFSTFDVSECVISTLPRQLVYTCIPS
jgi:hypothetical protein